MEITTQGIIEQLNALQIESMRVNLALSEKKSELEALPIVSEIRELEKRQREISKQEEEIKENGKQLLLSIWLKKFEALDGTTIQLNKKPGALQIVDESKVPDEYWTEKTTRSIDKTTLKKDISEGLIIEWVTISEDYTLIIKQ